MPTTEQHPSLARLSTTFRALGDFLAAPGCCRCEVLATCLRHLQEDASEHPASSRSLLRALRRVPSVPYVRRRFDCQRCEPAEILATYLTPGEQEARFGTNTLPALSWLEGEQDIHW